MKFIFRSHVSGAVYLFNGEVTICIQGASDRPTGKIMSGLGRGLFSESFLQVLSLERPHFMVDGNTASLCDQREAMSRGYSFIMRCDW